MSGPITEGWPKWLNPLQAQHIYRKGLGVEVVPLSDAERMREALVELLDGWTENIETDDPTRFENALLAARSLNPERGK